MVRQHIPIRDARDRIIERLGLGLPYPLRDLPVRQSQLKVPHNTTAKIPIQFSQRGVIYELHFEGQQVRRTSDGAAGAGEPVEAEGNGDWLTLETNNIDEPVTFHIYARKKESGLGAYLHQVAPVEVGLDTSLQAWIRDLPFLDETAANPPHTDPRIAFYGAEVTVEIANSQEGVDYQLVYLTDPEDEETRIPLSAGTVRGNLHNITITTRPVTEDIDIRIHATKTFDDGGRDVESDLLDVVLPLKVRANPALAVTIQPENIIGYESNARIVIAGTQRSARYRLFVRTMPDRDFIHGSGFPGPVIRVPVPNEPDVQVRQPPRKPEWLTPGGYTPSGGAPQAGNGGDLELALGPLTEDSLVIIQAGKNHRANGDTTIPSAVQLEQAAVILVAPNPAPPLRIRASIEGETIGDQIEVFDGQPGVFYYFRLDLDGDDLGLPVYFHKRDERDPVFNKGIDQLKLEIDFVVARSRIPGPTIDLARTPPEPPALLFTDVLPVDIDLYIRAVKARTRVATPLVRPVPVAAPPVIRAQETLVNYGAFTRLQVIESVVGDKYQPFLNGEPFKQARHGNDSDLSFNTDPITTDIVYDMVITQPNVSDMSVERVVPVPIFARPNIGLTVSAVNDTVLSGNPAHIRIADSQPHVAYQLVVDDSPTGQVVKGTGSMLILRSEPLEEDTTFAIRAARSRPPDAAVELEMQVTIMVEQSA